MSAGAVVALVAVAITLLVQVASAGSWVGTIKQRLTNQDEKLASLAERSERVESLLAGLKEQFAVRFSHHEAAGKPRRARKRS